MESESESESDESSRRIVAIDNGSSLIRAGIAGEDTPITFKTTAGCLESGIIMDWNAMEKIWRRIFNDELQINPEECTVLMSEPVNAPRGQREKVTEILMETFNVERMILQNTADLSIYGSGRNGAVAVDCGYHAITVTPRYEGYAMQHDAIKLPFGGYQITQHLQKLLREEGVCIEYEHCNMIKEQCGYVAQNGAESLLEIPICDRPNWLISAFLRNIDQNLSKRTSMDIERQCTLFCGDIDKITRKSVHYKLPDGQEITMTGQEFQCTELLFQRKFKEMQAGIQCAVKDVLDHASSNISSTYLNELYQNIVLCGGSSLFDGLQTRLTNEIDELRGNNNQSRVIALPQRQHQAWFGASVFAMNQSKYEEMWITKEEYEDTGSSIVHSKCW